MNNVINLNKFRKKKRREVTEKKANENRVRFGRSKTEKKNDQSDQKKSSQHLDAHKVEDEYD